MTLKSLKDRLNQLQIQRIYLTLWVALAIWSYIKGFIPGVQGWGKYLWLIDYSEGFIKRGFAGTAIHKLGYTLNNIGWGRLEILVLIIHTIAALLTIALLIKIQQAFFLSQKAIQPQQKTILLSACWLLFACTQFWPTLAYNTGYVDIYLLLAYTYAFYLFSRGAYLVGSLTGCLAVLTHEAFVFLWGSILFVFVVVPFLEFRQIDRKRIALSCLPILTVFLVLLLHDQAAAISEIRSIPNAVIEPKMKTILIDAQFGQTIRSATQVMLGIWQANTARGLAALVYYTFPAILMILSIPLMLGKHHQRVLKTVLIVFVASWIPLSILAIAWDLSRFLVWANLTTILTLTYFLTRQSNESARELL